MTLRHAGIPRETHELINCRAADRTVNAQRDTSACRIGDY